MIKCIPYGGISNRLKCIISCLAEYEHIYLEWEIPTRNGGVRCEFNDLFTNTFLTDFMNYEQSPSNVISHCEFIHPNMNTNNFGSKDILDEHLKNKYIEVIKTLKPVPYIQNKVDTILTTLPKDYTTVSVRTFRCFPAEYQSWGRHFKINNLFTYLNDIEGTFVLTCDDPQTKDVICEKYGDRVITIPKRTKFGDFESVEGMQDIIIDQLIGAKSKVIMGTDMSSYPEMQWWMGHCKSQYINMKLHEK